MLHFNYDAFFCRVWGRNLYGNAALPVIMLSAVAITPEKSFTIEEQLMIWSTPW